jgi:alpha-amylase
MHKKMIFVSRRLEKLKDKQKSRRKELKEAEHLLFKGQCNCPYWHGVFGGAYLTHLRSANYEALIGAQNILYDLENRTPVVSLEEADFDADGQNEIIVESPTVFCVISPHQGGCITELDFKPKRFNLQNTFTVYPEAYHKKLGLSGSPSPELATIHAHVKTKDKDLEKYLPHEGDPISPNWSFREHIDGRPLNLSYEAKLERRETSGAVSLKGSEPMDLAIEKRITLSTSRPILKFTYRLEKADAQQREIKLSSEFNFNFEAPYAADRYFKINGQKPSRPTLEVEEHAGNVTAVEIVDEWRKLAVRFQFEEPVSFERRPIFTVSLSEGGAEKTYQGSKLLFGYPLQLKGRQSLVLNFSLELLSL